MTIQISGKDYLVRRGITAVVESLGFVPSVHDSMVPSGEYELVIGLVNNGSDPMLSHLPAVLKHAPVLLVGEGFKRSEVQRLIGQGVQTIITTRCSADELEYAITLALKNSRFYCSEVLDTLTSAPEGTADLLTQLSKREREVLKLVLEGNTSQEISEMLYVSLHTINSHRKNILKKFKLKSPTELFLYAMEQDLSQYL